MPPITPAAMPQPRHRASAAVGAATEASANAPLVARIVNTFMEVSCRMFVSPTYRVAFRSDDSRVTPAVRRSGRLLRQVSEVGEDSIARSSQRLHLLGEPRIDEPAVALQRLAG